MQLRKLIRILKDIESKIGGHKKVTIQAKDFQGSPYEYHVLSSAGVSCAFFEDENGWLKDNSTVVVSLGLESPNVQEFK